MIVTHLRVDTWSKHFESILTPVCSYGDMAHSDPPCWGI